MSNDSVSKTFIVAGLLCVVCSLLVSSAAVLLKPLQVENKKLDVKKNLLLASGLLKNPAATKNEVLEAYKVVEAKVIDLSTGKETDIDPETFDPRKAEKDPERNKVLDPAQDLPKIKTRAQNERVYFVKDGDEVSMIVLPVHGKGLWSTMYGFIALAPDTRTIKGLGFYQHGETPGLGGEIDNPNWKKIWKGKVALDENYEPVINVVKGAVNPNSKNLEHKIDGLSGATITSVGVQATVNYWLGEDAFGPFLENFRQSGGAL